MEDMYRIVDGFENVATSGFFGVYDGHGGRQVSRYLHKHLDKNIELELKAMENSSIAHAFGRAYLITDIQCCQETSETCGATAVTCIIRQENNHRVLHTANVGDSRAVLCRKRKALRLSKDHKAEDPDECTRIRQAGGAVVKQRVMGILAVSRSFGDHGLKQYVIARPYTSTVRLGPEDAFVILACDGVWDVMSDQEAVDFVLAISNRANAAQSLVEEAMKRLSADNLTVVIVFLK